jgi:DNA-binding GntR family transcriptional regulator
VTNEVADLGDERPARQRPLAETAYDRFKRANIRCDLEPGQQLTDEQLAERFGLNRAAGRTGLTAMESSVG